MTVNLAHTQKGKEILERALKNKEQVHLYNTDPSAWEGVILEKYKYEIPMEEETSGSNRLDFYYSLDKELEIETPKSNGAITQVVKPFKRGMMTKAEYIAFHANACKRMIEITKAKNNDYTGLTDDPFANFADTPTFSGVTTEQGFLVRMGDKFKRIKSFIEKGVLEVKDESVEDTLLDLANYCILLAGWIKSVKGK